VKLIVTMSLVPQRLRQPAIILGAWTLYGLFSLYQTWIFAPYIWSRPRSFDEMFKSAMSLAWFWALCSLLIVPLARRYRIDGRTWRWAVPLHLGLLVAFSVVDAVFDQFKRGWLDMPTIDSPLLMTWMFQFDQNTFNYFAVVAITHVIDYHRQYNERRMHAAGLETRAARLEGQLTQAQLELLKMQLQPHFLFNTLHTIAELIHDDPAAADRMLTRLGDLLRLSLDNAGRQEVSLRQELGFLEAYLAIEQTRYPDRLTIATAIDPDTLDARVPHLLLQPLVENAIRHGVSARLGPGLVEIAARRMDGRVVIEIKDNGRGLPAHNGPPREGIGLSNTRARLRQLYGARHHLRLENRPDGGAVARLELPYQAETGERLNPDTQVTAEIRIT
jgi:signal transduction histidine kinase